MAMNLLPPEPILKGMTQGQTMQQFIQGWSDVDRDFDGRCDELVDRVVRFLQKHTPYSVSGIVKGGSIGKSTFISEKSDIDIIFFINEVKSVQDLQHQVTDILYTLRSTLESKWQSFAGTLQYQRTTKHGIRFRLSCHDIRQEQEVDILPAFNVSEGKSKLQIFNDMKFKTEEQRSYYSVCFARQQVDFVKQAPIKLKNLIKLFKYWAKNEVNVEDKAISSYCLEVIVMYRWQRWGSPQNFETDDKFEEIMVILADLPSLHIVWEDRYDAGSYWRIPSSPVVLDPANPFINLVPLQKHQAWVKSKASEVVRRIQALKHYRAQRR